MSLITTAKTKAVKGNVKEAFKNEEGAIDLASIMVGIIVIGLVGGVIAATVFAVIPWAQDNAAKQQLDSIASAQSAYVGLASDTAAIAFGSEANLKTKGLFDGANVTDLSIQVTGTGTGAHYGAVVKSSSGNWFKITDTKTQPTPIGENNSGGTPVTDEGGAAHSEATLNTYAAINAAK